MSQPSSLWSSSLLFLVISSACTDGSSEAKKQEHAPPAETAMPPEIGPPPPLEVTKVTTTISVASVQMIQDCPDPEPEPSEAAAAAERAAPARAPSSGARAQPYRPGDEDVGGGRGFRQPCDQSTVQLALETDNEGPVAIEIKAVRISFEGKPVGELNARTPMVWTESAYQPWDQLVAPNTPTKASYKLSLPNWSKVEEAIGGSSYGPMFTLELDITVDGELRTVSSPEVPREMPHVIVT
jgi:hypothetical protein